MDKFEDKLNEAKSHQFKESVLKASRSLGLPKLPQVKIWDGKCPYGANEIAHAHPDKKLICISKGRLYSMTLDEIDEVATHETSHMLHEGHDSDFSDTHENAQLAGWLQSHLLRRTRYNMGKHRLKPENSKPNKNVCNRHGCNKRGKLTQCEHCEKYFCNEHSKPRMVLTLYQVNRAKEPIKSRLEEEYRSEDGHPDMGYTQQHWEDLEREDEKRKEKMWQTLDRMKESKKVPLPPIFSELPKNIKRIFEPKREEGDYSYHKRHTKVRFPSFSSIGIYPTSNSTIWIGLILLVVSTFLIPIPLFTESPYNTFAKALPQMKEDILTYLKTNSFNQLSITFFFPLSIVLCMAGILFRSGTLIVLAGLLSLLYPITFYNSYPIIGAAISVTWPFFMGVIGSAMIIYGGFQERITFKALFIYLVVGILFYFLINGDLIEIIKKMK